METAESDFKLSSPAFAEGQPIPARFTADGSDVSPPLVIAEPPDGTVSLALIMDDPDAPVGTWVHWVAWNIPAETVEIAEGKLPEVALSGRNSWRRTGYGGPSPPSGTHRYFFKLYALSAELELPESTDKAALVRAMEGHTLAQATLMGTYTRER
jgi:Raf kinase inhibitor-like YbhB/YbcL family protein